MSKTRTEFITEVLLVLEVLATGQSPAPEDYSRVNNKLNGILAELNVRDSLDSTDTDEFEDEIVPALADYVAARIGFGVEKINGYDLETFAQLAERRLRRIGRAGDREFVTKTEYF